MSIAKVRSALVQAFVTGSFFNQTEVAYENKKFDPPKDKPWAAFFFVPIQPVVFTLGTGGYDEQRGFVQIDLNYPTDDGEKDVAAKADAIRDAFKAGFQFSYSGQEVRIVSCGRSQGRSINNYYRVSITIQFLAFIVR